MLTFEKSELVINCWNIYGLFNNLLCSRYNKLDTPELAAHISQYKLFGLVETHHGAEDITKLQLFGTLGSHWKTPQVLNEFRSLL